MTVALLLLASYLLGSWNFAITVLRIGGFPDPRTQHSGNAGTSNVARIAGRPVAALVLALDLLRSVAVYQVARRFAPAEAVPWAGLALLLGNRFPLFHRFRGGKGVATYLGFLAAAEPWLALAACAAWLVTYLVGKVVAIASMTMLAVLVAAAVHTWPRTIPAIAPTVLSAALILVGHRSNWAALRKSKPAA
jgi:acyl phosphate:glycerol-3-phosphate acyltransferase